MDWPRQFARVASDLKSALAGVPGVAVEHVGSTSVPGLAAKPIIDIDVVADPETSSDAIAALENVGYVHLGDLGVAEREALKAPDENPRRNVYVCARGALSLRNHLAVRDVLRRRGDLREEYAAVKLQLAEDPGMDIDTYLRRKSAVLQRVLAASDLTESERRDIAIMSDG